nr:unnamed protein product [Callosobruchus analis]
MSFNLYIYMPVPTEEKWRLIAKRFYELWDLPNCLGSIDGKHCRITEFYSTGSQYYNYKSFFSVVLMACADADGLFITIDVGEAGRNSHGAVFRGSALGKLLDKEKLNIPKPTVMPNDTINFPFYFYPQRVLDNEKRIFNYRLSRGRKSAECSFGMLVKKFAIFQGPILCQEQTAIPVIKAACVLHNFIKISEGKFSTPQVTKQNQYDMISVQSKSQCSNRSAYELRDYLKTYFIRPENSLPWQNQCTV